MYQMRYEDVVEDGSMAGRARESALFGRCISLLQTAKTAGAQTPQVHDAVVFTRRLWLCLIEDLGQEGNALPTDIKASLISIGFFILKQMDRLEAGQPVDFDALIEVSQSIRDGLSSQTTESRPKGGL